MLGPKIAPKDEFYQQTPGFGVQIPASTGLEQFYIPKMSDFKSMFLVQNINSYLSQAFSRVGFWDFCPFAIPFPTPPYWGAFRGPVLSFHCFGGGVTRLGIEMAPHTCVLATCQPLSTYYST
jgi:hypothetical protein